MPSCTLYSRDMVQSSLVCCATVRIVPFLHLWVRCALVACRHFLLALKSCGTLILLDVHDRALVKKFSENSLGKFRRNSKISFDFKNKIPLPRALNVLARPCRSLLERRALNVDVLQRRRILEYFISFLPL